MLSPRHSPAATQRASNGPLNGFSLLGVVALAAIACVSDGGRNEAAPDESTSDIGPVPPAFAAAHASWRADRLTSLRREDGWLSVVGLHWLSPGSHRIGTGSDNQVVLPQVPSMADEPSSVATLVVETGSSPRVLVETAEDANLLLDGRRILRSELQTDATANPSILRIGSLSLTIIERGGELALRVRDLESRKAERLTEIPTWPPNPRLAVVGQLERASGPGGVELENVAGQLYSHPSVGTVHFELDGRKHSLVAVGAALDAPLLLIVADETNGDETYKGGRYLAAQVAEDGITVDVDFNRLYNPPCVFTEFATCPLPPPSNRLSVRLAGGEKLPPEFS